MIIYSSVYSGTDQRKHQSSASLAFARGIHWRPVNSPHKWPVTRKMFPFDDVIMEENLSRLAEWLSALNASDNRGGWNIRVDLCNITKWNDWKIYWRYRWIFYQITSMRRGLLLRNLYIYCYLSFNKCHHICIVVDSQRVSRRQPPE